MAWIESHQGLARHIKTKRFARKLGITIPAAIGHLHLLWWWAMDNLPDGNLSLVDSEDIADEMMYEGNADGIIDSLLSSGFIDDIDGSLFIHDWHDYIGRLLEKRRQDTERKRKNRGKDKVIPQESDGCPAGHDAEGSEDGARNSTVPYLTNNTTMYDDFEKVKKAYAEIHSVLDMPYSDSPHLTRLLEDGFKPDFIIGIIKERYKPSVKTLKFYEGAIRDSVERAPSNKSRGFHQKAAYREEPRYGVYELTQDEIDNMPRG